MRCRRDGAIGTRQQRPYNGPNTKPSPVHVGRDRLPFVLTCRFCGCPPYGTTLSGYSKNPRPAAGLCVLFDGGFLRRYALARASEPASCRGTQRTGGAGVGGWGGVGGGSRARWRACAPARGPRWRRPRRRLPRRRPDGALRGTRWRRGVVRSGDASRSQAAQLHTRACTPSKAWAAGLVPVPPRLKMRCQSTLLFWVRANRGFLYACGGQTLIHLESHARGARWGRGYRTAPGDRAAQRIRVQALRVCCDIASLCGCAAR